MSHRRLPSTPLTLLLALAVPAAAAGCGDDGRTVAPRVDAGPRPDGGPDGGPGDAGAGDGGVDGDGGIGQDGGTFDPLPEDHDPWGAGDPDVCAGPSPPPTCMSDVDCNGQTVDRLTCTEGLCTCVRPGGCGEDTGYCARRGNTCSSDTSCGGDTVPSECATAPGGGRFCQAPPGGGTGCYGSWDCPQGFECEPADGSTPTSDGTVCANGEAICACVDRRLPCRLDEAASVAGVCPAGYTCTRSGGASRAWCLRPRPCPRSGVDVGCNEGEVCLNPTGALFGGVCVREGACASDADCEGTEPDVVGDRCTMSIVTGRTICGFDAPCDPAAPACGENLTCNPNVHTAGTAFCHPTRPDGSERPNCQSDAECRAGARCVWLDGNPPADPEELVTEPLPYAECTCFDPDLGEAGGSRPCEGRPAG